MFEEKKEVKVYRVTIKKIIERLLTLQNVAVQDFQNEVQEQFEGYDYKDVEDVVGFESWADISNDGKYELRVKVDHEDAYEFTLHIEVKEQKISVKNVL